MRIFRGGHVINDINPINTGEQGQILPRQKLPEEGNIPEDTFVPQSHKFFGQGLIEKLFGGTKSPGHSGGTSGQGSDSVPPQTGQGSSPVAAQTAGKVGLKAAAQHILKPPKLKCEKQWTSKLDHEYVKYYHHGNGPVIASCSGGDSPPGIKSLDPRDGGKALWSYGARGDNLSEPFIGKDLIFFGEDCHGVVALDSRTGKEVRRFPTDGAVNFSPCVDDRGRLFCADSEGQVYAFDSGSGDLLWKKDLGAPSEKVLVVDNMVIIRDSEGRIYGLDGDRGKKKWSFKTGGCQYYRPIEGGSSGLIYTRRENELNTLLAIDVQKGKLRWQMDTERWIKFYSSHDGTLYLGAGKNLSAINGATGEKKWEIVSPGDDFSYPPAVGPDGHLFVHNEFTEGQYDLSNPDLDAVLSIEPQSGDIDWVSHFPRYGPMYNGSPIVCEGGLVCLPSLHGDVLTGFSAPDIKKIVASEGQQEEEARITVSDDQDFVDVNGVRLPRNAMNHYVLKRYSG